MNQLLSNCAFLLLTLTAVFQAVYVFLYRCQLRAPSLRPGTGDFNPKTAVVLCLRGIDPSLARCLDAITNQNYKNFEVHIVMDHESDPAQTAVRNFLAGRATKRPVLNIVTLPSTTGFGSLKCQALVHVIEQELSSDVEVVVLVDADAIVHESWLSRLIAPLAVDEIAASTGNRWFSPQDAQLGSWVREIWNAAAIVQMQLYQIPWGGSLAIKTAAFDETDLISRWRVAFCEDTLMTDELEQNEFKVYRVPEVIVNNTESTSLSSAISWITRQLLTVRLYHHHWFWVFGHAMAVGACVFLVPAIILWLVLSGSIFIGVALLIAWIGYQVVNGLLLNAIRAPNRLIMGAQVSDSDRQWSRLPNFKNYALALLLSQMVQPIAAVRALVAQTVTWRGVEYHLENDSTVRLTEYRPFTESEQRGKDSIQ